MAQRLLDFDKLENFHTYSFEYMDPEVNFIANKMSKSNTGKCRKLIKDFCRLHDIRLHSILIDMRKTVNKYETEGLFGGFVDLYDKVSNTMYYNPYNFVEFSNPKSPTNIAHLACHELVHTKQIQTTEMRIYKSWKTHNYDVLKYKGKTYRRAPFSVDLFNRIREKSGALAEEYHYTALPWEKDAYKLAEEFIGRPLWKSL